MQGQIAVLRDDGDLILPANPYDLRSTAVTFARNGVGGFDVRRSDRAFQSSVGDKVPLDDDDSAPFTLPFTFPFYSGRYSRPVHQLRRQRDVRQRRSREHRSRREPLSDGSSAHRAALRRPRSVDRRRRVPADGRRRRA